MTKKLINPFLNAMTGAAIIAAGGIDAAYAQEKLERECEPWKPGTYRLGSCGFNTEHLPFELAPAPDVPTPFNVDPGYTT